MERVFRRSCISSYVLVLLLNSDRICRDRVLSFGDRMGFAWGLASVLLVWILVHGTGWFFYSVVSLLGLMVVTRGVRRV